MTVWLLRGEAIYDGDDLLAVAARTFEGKTFHWEPADFLHDDRTGRVLGSVDMSSPESRKRLSDALRQRCTEANRMFAGEVDWVV